MPFVTSNYEIKYHNILDTTAAIFKEEGLFGFFSGLRMRVAIQSFSSAIAWGTYQVVKSGLSHAERFKHWSFSRKNGKIEKDHQKVYWYKKLIFFTSNNDFFYDNVYLSN